MEREVLLVERRTPRLVDASPVTARIVKIVWSDGIAEHRDISPILANHRSLIRLRIDDALFVGVRVVEDGTGLEWSDGSKISATSLLALPRSEMSNQEFRNVMDDLHISIEALSLLLGLSKRVISDYRAAKAVPKHVALALRYVAERSDRLVL
ncbi:hypothetical protein [Paradevosia shaoguanensis]|uniref:DUF2442 domain-containing protein n=1 Tax=Paradevosia shaoguanensis TaxID=1335043 RepID=A0AA41QND0_9HYPH|nr:hypothetical protein [Paradevosia shaoguanensis]MCF1742884.1 hypothetical protein [Paradevosia shaoguanensis]MCI0127367.1 hypothetical protein [Paradevosia shaoguanensis]